MLKSSRALWLVLACFVSPAAACGGDDSGPAGPTPVEPEAVTLTGTWAGSFDGQVISSDRVGAELEQSQGSHGERNTSGTWSAMVRLPPVPGAPTEVELGGVVTGNATGGTAELLFAIEGFADYFPEGCGLSVSVSSFDATTMEASWTTNDQCQPPAVDEGMMVLMRQ